MAKRGETRPWKTIYTWSNGIHGISAWATQEAAEADAQRIRGNAEYRDDVTVTVQVEKRENKP